MTPTATGRSGSPQQIPRKISPPRQQPPHTPDELQFAKRTLQKLVQDSHFFPVLDKNNRVQTIKEDELDFGSVIGKGGFCEVRCASLKYSRSWGGHSRSHQRSNSTEIATPKYAMKYLSPSKTASSRVFQRGVADLAMEACFLSLLSHENIIGLHYVSEGSLEENYNCADNHNHNSNSRGNDEVVLDAHGNLQLRRQPPSPQPNANYHFFGYFLLLDPLHETLTDRIERTYIPQVLEHNPTNNNNNNMWDRIRHKNNHNTSSGGINPKVQLVQRLEILKCIALALKYLHDECHIVFRDIKPDNIGFYRRYHPHCSCGYYENNGGNRDGCTCYDEVTKLFDFGLAKELKPKYRKSHPAYPDQDTYKLTGCTGSRRYMAPEVCFSDPYNHKADVYSYGMLLYQVASLVTPFDGFSMGKHEREVLRGGFRPDVKIPSTSFLKGKKSASSMQQEQMLAEGGLEGNSEKKNLLLALRTKRCWPKELPRIMEECWDYDMRYRPGMKDVTYRLERCIDDFVQGKIVSTGIVPGHWPKFSTSPLNNKDEACGGTLETSPMSFNAFSLGGGIVDNRSFSVNHQQQYQNAQSFSPESVSSNAGKKCRRNVRDEYSNTSDQAVYQQRRSSKKNAGDDTMAMQWLPEG
eukprot:CAMPEP_0172327116 /NCGR_PEP_ID=MMETSP1058-20130122/58671_1 /TAXON_ID=83371 /ORGANISM="Detonula confervacea, Strain CCMP 353" /LENGTH=635 /DNA_ID=CAMNT_0013044073 /DNA_START=29 /DNA_END=1936 /DNA_ORIENTATION=-